MFKEKFNKMFNSDDGKKNIENAVVCIIILVITVIIINSIWKDKKQDTTKTNTNAKQVNAEVEDSSNLSTSKQLEKILSKIDGVGKVEVMITYSESNQTLGMYNENYKESQTEETDTSGGKRVINEVNKDKEIVFKEENGQKVPVVEKTVLPKIEGALVVAEGASNSDVKANIINAVTALTGLASHKIQVMSMKI